MAIRTIAQLKAWFRKGLYPTESQFSDWLDSYRHRYDKVAMPEVSGLPEAMNKKYDRSEANELDSRLSGEIRRLRELLPDAAGGSSKVVFFDGFTDFDGELKPMSSVAGQGLVLFALRKGRFVFMPDGNGGSFEQAEYYSGWQGMDMYNVGASAREECVFVLRGSYRPYVCADGMLVELSHSGMLEFYQEDDFGGSSYSHLTEDLTKVRIDCGDSSTEYVPEDVLYTPDDCIVYDRASARFVHRRITRGELPGVYPPTVGVVRVEFRNRWLDCGRWGTLGPMGAEPGDRIYYCAGSNLMYTYHNIYDGNGSCIFGPVQS